MTTTSDAGTTTAGTTPSRSPSTGMPSRSPRAPRSGRGAEDAGIDIPVLCHDERFGPVGVCRMCVVDVGGRVLRRGLRAAVRGRAWRSTTASRGVERSRGDADRAAARRPARRRRRPEADHHRRLRAAGARPSATASPGETADLPPGHRHVAPDLSSPVIAVDHEACILCDRCVRACDDIQCNDVIGRTGKGYATRIAFDLDDPMGAVHLRLVRRVRGGVPDRGADQQADHAVPLRPARRADARRERLPVLRRRLRAHLPRRRERERDRLRRGPRPAGVDRAGSASRAATAGTTPRHPQRLTKPLIRRRGSTRRAPLLEEVRGEHDGDAAGAASPAAWCDYDEVLPHFREATWDEALDLVAARLLAIQQQHGPGALAGFGSAKCTNEEAYLFQKLMRAGFGTNNVDHCTRLCHASSRRGAARRHRLRRRHRRPTATSRNADVVDPHRHQHDGQPPGRRDVLQAGAPSAARSSS